MKPIQEFVKEELLPHIKDQVEGSVSLYANFTKWLSDLLEERDRQQWEAGCRESAKAICPTCAAGDVPRPHSKLGGWFHIGEHEDKQRIGCSAAPIHELTPPAAQPAEEG